MKTDKHKFHKISFAALPLCGMLLFCFALFNVPATAQNQPKMSSRILLVPLDDRPPTVQFVVKMGEIGDAEVITPPKEILGRFTEPGKPDEIIKWLRAQDLNSFDAAIVALDMVAYGGLVASRVHGDTNAETALARIEILRELKKINPRMPVYAQSVIMRLAPTGTGANESYRQKLADWAEVSPYADAESKKRTMQLEREIPAEAINDYKRARARNLQINLKAVEMTRNGTIDRLILSQDDAKPRGIHVADREKLIAETKRLNLTEKIAVQPGADEVAMLLLARVITDKYDYRPKIKAVYSSEELANKAMPYEDRALRETVSFHIKAVGAREVTDEKTADLIFYVYPSRFEKNRAASFAEEIEAAIKRNRRVIVADVDSKGDVQGGDPAFTRELERRGLFPELSGYAAWNTAGNTIGTALPQGVIFDTAQNKLMKSKARATRVWTAQNWFTLNRLLDDFYYHTLTRAETKKFIAENNFNPIRLSDEAAEKVENFAAEIMRGYFEKVGKEYFTRRAASMQKNVKCAKPSEMTFDLPWNRTFEAEIDFQLKCGS